jgi:conjugative relaxase-like TrwC/TraI family protein
MLLAAVSFTPIVRLGSGCYVRGRMQTTHKISGGAAAGYAAYLTSPSDRGDYYTESGEGEGEADGGVVMVPSRWHGSPALLAALGLSPGAPVEREDLASLMRGVSPVDGGELRRAGGDGSRVAGIDLTFSAPKSVSALWAVSSRYERARIEAAHTRAVAGTVARIEREVELVRTRKDGQLQWQRAERLLAAEFVHTASRLTRDQEGDGVPDPQLHSHVVVLGAERTDGRYVAVDSRELFRSARANGAWYRAELAHGLGELGLEIQGRTGRGGRYFEIAGVPQSLSERWSMRGVEIERAARAFRSRYGRDPRAGELGSLTVQTRGTKTVAEAVDVDAAWRAVGEEFGLSREHVQALYLDTGQRIAQTGLSPEERERDLARELPRELTRERSVVSDRDMRASAYELAAGVVHPEQADRVVDGLVHSGELVALQDGLWTTRELRELEQRTLELAAGRANEPAARVGEESLRVARIQAQREIGAPLSGEQRQALEAITGRGGVSVLVGQAGTGKGVVISTAADAWQRDGYRVIGTAVAGATAERLRADAKLERSVTTDALLARAETGSLHLDGRTVVVMDEAGMADTKRLAAVTELTARQQSKLVLVGDQAQLPSIGAGGMFEALQQRVPTATVSEVHRAQHEWERDAWQQIRAGESQRALASYQAHERLHITDTRSAAAERMVDAWDQVRLEHPEQRTVMLTDASNLEMDRINALAQERRARAGELGAHQVQLPDRPYGLAAGDEVIFTAALRPPGRERVENGTLGTVIDTNRDGGLTIRTQGSTEREVNLDTGEFTDLRLSYAQHVYKAQGRTVQRAFVLTGGWQTDREHAYVALTRARERTDIYVSREDLGEQGVDAGAVERLADSIARSNAQQPSIAHALDHQRVNQREHEHKIASPTQTVNETRELRPGLGANEGPETRPPERDRERDAGLEIE